MLFRPLVVVALFALSAVSAHADTSSTIEGTLTSHDGRPIAGAIVVAQTNSYVTPKTITDGAGHFRFTRLKAGVYKLLATHRLHGTLTSQVTVGEGTTATVALAFPGTKEKQREDAKQAKAEAEAPAPKDMQSMPSPPPPPPPAMPSPMGRVAPTRSAIAGAPAPLTVIDQVPGHNTEAYARIDENPYLRVDSQPLSTFSSDVDTASYANLRRFLRDGTLPPKDAVRIEEMLNYFRYDYPAPKNGQPFSVTTEVGASPFNAKYQLVRIGIQAPAIPDTQIPARNLVFLLDVSGSMQDANKLPLVKRAMNLLVENMRPQDRIAIAVYAGSSGLALPSTSGSQKDVIRTAIAHLEAGGSTNGAAGIQLAYQVAQAHFIKGGINRVILATDGDFNVGTTSEGDLTRLIEKQREKGVFLSVLGFGMGNLKDSTMEKLADRGNGNYAYIDTIDEARKVLVKEAGATLVTVAKDVKLQVEFNPQVVAGYRLIGYENRLLRNEDFNDDKKDAGDIGAGHSVTALYEIVPVGVPVPGATVDALKYQTKAAANGAGAGELMTVKVRYKTPTGSQSKLLAQPVKAESRALAQTSTDFRWAAAVAGFGMMLRSSKERGALTWAQVASMAEGAIGADREGYRKQMLEMVRVAAKLKR